MSRRSYQAPSMDTERCFESSALSCGKTSDPPPGSFHFGTPDQNWFTGHFGPGMGGSESYSGTVPPGTMPVTSQSYAYSGLCLNWVTWQS